MTKLMLKLDKAYLTYVTNKGQKGLPFPTGVKEYNDISYIYDGSIYHLLDVYVPEGTTGKLPVIFNVHGGSWCFGTKEDYKRYCMDLSKRGFAVVSFSYTLAPDATYYEQVQEAYQVMHWMVENVDKYHLDLNNVFAIGDSAGANLCGVIVNITYDDELRKLFKVEVPFPFRAMCLNCPASELKDMANLFGKLVFKHIIGPGFRKSPYYSVANYLDTVSVNSCPVFVITSYKDFMKKMSLRVYNTLKEKGVKDVRLSYIKDKSEHSKNMKPVHVYSVNPFWEESIKVNNEMCDFFKEYVVK